MKLIQITSTLLLAASAMAQRIAIASPRPGEVLTIGQSFTVEVDLPDQLTATQSVSVVIGLQGCGADPCPVVDDDQILGQILYSGAYTPERHEQNKQPYQNFTFTLDNKQPEQATIHVVHLALVGAGPEPLFEIQNVSVSLADATGAKFRRSGL